MGSSNSKTIDKGGKHESKKSKDSSKSYDNLPDSVRTLVIKLEKLNMEMAQSKGVDETQSAFEAAMTKFASMKKLESIKLARLSSFYYENTTYIALLVREMGTFDAKRKLGKNIRPGYLIVKNKSWVEKHLSHL